MEHQKKLYRLEENSVLGGVCCGIAEYLDADVAVVRIIALIMFFSGFGILPYLICWLAIPKKYS